MFASMNRKFTLRSSLSVISLLNNSGYRPIVFDNFRSLSSKSGQHDVSLSITAKWQNSAK